MTEKPAKRPRGTGSLFLRGQYWWIAYHRNGQEIRETSKSTRREVAENLLKRRLGDIASGRPVTPRADRVKVGALLEDCISEAELNQRRSIAATKRRAKKMRIAFGNRYAHSITAADLRTYQLARQRTGAANATINREIAVLRRAFRLGIESEKIHRMPVVRQLREDNVRSGFFDDERFESLIAEIRDPKIGRAHV